MKATLLVVALAIAVPARADVTPPGGAENGPRRDGPIRCGTAEWKDARRAVIAFCAGAARLDRAYYEEPPRKTKARACADLRRELAAGHDFERTDDGAHLSVTDTTDVLTYWEVDLAHRKTGFVVTKVDFEEDCTGP